MATGVEVIAKPLFTNTAHRIELVFWVDEEQKNRKVITGETIIVLIVDGANVRSYPASIDDGAEGEAHVDLNASYHSTAATVSAQVHEDGVPKAELTLTFRTKMAEV